MAKKRSPKPSRTGDEVTREAEYVASLAGRRDARIVFLSQLLFFSTDTGDAWMLDPEDGFAMCLARDGQKLPFQIMETPTQFRISWNMRYRIEGEAMVFFEESGRVRTVVGYPVREIEEWTVKMKLSARPSAPEAAPPLRQDDVVVPAAMRDVYDKIIQATNQFCGEHLNEEYASLARQMAGALARKRPSPLPSGSVEGWACGIMYVLGRVNFLFDPADKPYLTAAELCAAFGVSKSSGAARAKRVEELLRVRGSFDPRWTLPTLLRDSAADVIEVDGITLDLRRFARSAQYLRGGNH
jgi:hypothetical protein